MKVYLGVDGGGTKTKFALCNENGEILAQSIQSTCHYLQCGLDGVSSVMRKGLDECLKQANLTEGSIASSFVACAGYGDIEEDNPKIEEAVKAVYSHFPCSVGNDTDNALAGALGGKCGINVIAGTGSIALGVNEKGERFRSGGWHHAFGGDEGSAYWLACKLILEFTRQSDGRDEKTELYNYMMRTFDFKNDSDILQRFVVEWEYDRTKIASLATHAYELALLHDPYALNFYHEAAIELADIVLAIYQHLHFTKSVHVSYAGGVFKSEEFLLKPFTEILNKQGLIVCKPLVDPDKGSLILAMQEDHCAITQTIIENLKRD